MARSSPPSGGSDASVTPAVRASRPGWRDPRLWLGIAIVAASVVVGARVLGGADDTVQVWAVAGDVGVGERLDADDLVARRVRFADSDDLERYLAVDDTLPDDATVLRPLGAGELVPVAALGGADDSDTVTISLAVEPTRVPSGVSAGSVVDVYVLGAGRRGGGGSGSGPALSEVTVVAAPPSEETLTATGDRQVELAVPDTQVTAFYALLDGSDQPTISIAQVS